MNVIMVADNTSILVTANTKDALTKRLNFILILISKRFQANCLILNPICTNYIIQCIQFNMCRSIYTCIRNYKVLGLAT